MKQLLETEHCFPITTRPNSLLKYPAERRVMARAYMISS